MNARNSFNQILFFQLYFLVLTISGKSSLAQCETVWERQLQGSPCRSFAHMSVFDGSTGKVLLFGGASGGMCQDGHGQTYLWNGVNWDLVATTGPVERAFAGIAFDSLRNRAVLYGGGTGGPVALSDTWEWDGAMWTQIPVTGPGPRGVHAMAYDAARGNVVLYGDGTDTWTYDGSAWTQVSVTGPGYRQSIQMAYDERRERIVLFGGFIGLVQPIEQNDTWEWDGASWTRVATTGPSRRSSYAMTYDSYRGKVVLFGGGNAAAAYFNDTWEWDGTVWTRINIPGPSARRGMPMVYDPTSREIILFGGATSPSPTFLDDTWAFSISSPADFNADNITNSQDFFDYLTAFFSAPTCTNCSKIPCPADFNHDCIINSADFFAFLAAFLQGCP